MKTSASPQKNRTLKAFFIAFGIYSIAIFSLLYANTKLPQNVGVQPQSISIALTQFVAQTTPTPQEIKPIEEIKEIQKPIKKKKKRKKKKEPIPTPQNIAQTESKTQPSTNTTTAPQATQEPQTLVFGKTNDPFLISIKQAIDKNLHYPRKARMMKLSGIVNIKFELLKDGRVQNIKIIDSSGHGILDKSAHKTILDARAYFPQPKNNVTIQIPIQYKLI